MDKSYRILLAGNPNVGKSTVFNALTGLKQHTGNWTGKTVDLASGSFEHKGASFHIQDLPGTYSLISNSPEEEIARDAISSEETDLILVVADATCLARNLNLLLQILEINTNAVLCINLLDEATRKKITLDFQTLEENLHIPVIGISAHKHKDILNLKEFLYTSVQTPRHRTTHPPVLYPTSVENAIQAVAEVIPEDIDSVRRRFLALKTLDNESAAKKITSSLSSDELARIQETAASTKEHLEQCGIPAITFRDILVETLVNRGIEIADACVQSNKKDTPHIFLADKILTSRRWGIPIILVFLAFLLWITISGANIPSALLMEFFLLVKPAFAALLSFFSCPEWLLSLLTEGIYQTTTWVTSVMLPPMLIFFPLFTMLEDLGVLPRLAFNLDSCFKKSGSCGKQALTMCMGLGCNAVGVTGCRIISHKRQRLAAMVTNCFIPCNGRFSLLITLSSLFIGGFLSPALSSFTAALFLLFLLLCGVGATLAVTALITRLFHNEKDQSFFLELPSYRKPQLSQILVRSLFDRTLKILWRALRVSAPAGALIWFMTNTTLDGQTLLALSAHFFDPVGQLLGMDGMILLAFLLALPANEIFLPILLMGYLASGNMIEASNLAALKSILVHNHWTILTAINVTLFSVLHFPCATTLYTIKKESGSFSWAFLGFIIPTATAILVCFCTTVCWRLFAYFL